MASAMNVPVVHGMQEVSGLSRLAPRFFARVFDEK
jgi:hypothetical protein